MPVIYIDVLFFVNLFINYILLRACSVLCRLRMIRLRILLGSIAGAIYAVLIFFPDFSVIYSTLAKLLISMLLVAISFPFYSMKEYLKALFVFYMVSFGFGGCVLCTFYFSQIGAKLGAIYSNGILYFNLPWQLLVVSGMFFYSATKLFAFFSKRSFRTNGLKKKLYLTYDNKTAEITALLDTGNSLVDPVSLSPVIVAEYRLMKNLFSDEIRSALDNIEKSNITWIMNEIVQKGLPARLIPFSSIGKSNGMLIGFVPDKAEIRDECGIRVLEKCVVAISATQISKDRSYGALLNPYM